jgi:hypothetical protein
MVSENRMSVRSLIPLALALFAARCSDPIGAPPTAVPQQPGAAPHFLRWAGTSSPQFSASGAISAPVTSGGLLASLTPGLSLQQYTASLWAVRGQQRSVQINYLSSTGDTSAQFLRFTADDPAYVPGVGNLAPGDSVLITLTVNPDTIKVSLGPTGLQFGNPAQLQVWYGGAGGDLNGDGVVDSIDARIETQLLGMWYRERVDSAWTKIPATQSLTDKSFLSVLQHFCEYAVSW